MIGTDLLDYLKTMRARLDFIGRHAEVWELDLAGRPAKVLFLPRTEPLPDEPSLGVDQYIISRGLAEQVVGTVYPDRRSAGYGLSRFRDNARLDFTKIAKCPEVHFAHARGFVAKTTTSDIGRLKELMTQAGVSAATR